MAKTLTNRTKEDEGIQYQNPLNEGGSFLASRSMIDGRGITYPVSGLGLIDTSVSLNAPIIKSFIPIESIAKNDAVVNGINTHSIDLERSSSQYLDVADNAPLSITGDMTIEAMIKLESKDITQTIVAKYLSSGNNRSYFLSVNAGDNKLLFTISGDGSAGTATEGYSSTALTTGTWYHVAVVYNAVAGTAQFYLDGADDGLDTTMGTSIHDGTGEFEIGANTASSFWDGLIDEVRIWSRKRTADEIGSNKDKELIGNESGLEGYWRLNNDLTDSGPNGLANLTNHNSAVFSTDINFTQGAGIIKSDASIAATANGFLGFAIKAVSKGEEVNVLLNGVIAGFTGITVGGQFYLSDTAGRISTSAGTVSRKVGIGISETEIYISNIF